MNFSEYELLYKESIDNPEKFWTSQAGKISWSKKWKKVKRTSFKKPVSIEWFIGGELNASYNCIDRHVKSWGSKAAIIFEHDNPKTPARTVTYQELQDEVSLMANVLKKHGVKKGDRVTIYMPMIPEVVFAMHACNRIGAIHNVIFGGFSADSIVDRVKDCESTFLITADEGRRGGKIVPLKKTVDEALDRLSAEATKKMPCIGKVLVIKNTGAEISIKEGRDLIWEDEKETVESICELEVMGAEDPLFILYTSGSTGKPKGVLHTTGGYLVFATTTYQYIFDYKKTDVFWCTADVGWITGHTYLAYGPLTAGATVLMFEGIPTYPDASRFWDIIDKHKVTVFYTAPTAIRSLMRESLDYIKKFSLKSLRLMGSVGEPINPEAWNWLRNNAGGGRVEIMDTWWQTETGGILISPIPKAIKLKPGSATLPFFGIKPVLLTEEGKEIKGTGSGVLAISDSWPGQMRTVYKNHKRFEETYFTKYPGYFLTGDDCKRDDDGYYWITGRNDDVLKVSGHRIGTAEIESALASNEVVAEAAVVGFPHAVKGQGIYVFVTLKNGITPSDELKKELINHVRRHIGPIATPDLIQWAPGLPKTRSGKIMRRLLRLIAENKTEDLGDISTLADSSVVAELVENRLNK